MRECRLLILFTLEPLPDADGAFYSCMGTPPTPFTVELREPRGNRRLMDARRYPPVDVTDVRPQRWDAP